MEAGRGGNASIKQEDVACLILEDARMGAECMYEVGLMVIVRNIGSVNVDRLGYCRVVGGRGRV